MNRIWIVGAALVAVLGLPAVARSHTGHAHKVMGTLAAVHENHLEVKTTDDKIVAITLDANTVYQRGKAKADVKMLKVGERVVVEGLQADGAKTITAKSVQMAAVPATAAR